MYKYHYYHCFNKIFIAVIVRMVWLAKFFWWWTYLLTYLVWNFISELNWISQIFSSTQRWIKTFEHLTCSKSIVLAWMHQHKQCLTFWCNFLREPSTCVVDLSQFLFRSKPNIGYSLHLTFMLPLSCIRCLNNLILSPCRWGVWTPKLVWVKLSNLANSSWEMH